MFAVIKTGGKQYKVAAEDTITVMTLPGEAGARIVFDEVLALFDGATSHVGAPRVAGASVVGEIVEQTRGPKVYAFKKRRRKNSKRKRGHKQDLTIVRVTDILTGGDGPGESGGFGERIGRKKFRGAFECAIGRLKSAFPWVSPQQVRSEDYGSQKGRRFIAQRPRFGRPASRREEVRRRASYWRHDSCTPARNQISRWSKCRPWHRPYFVRHRRRRSRF